MTGFWMTPEEAKLILTFADEDMKIKFTAEKLGVMAETVANRINRVHGKTGLNPRVFHDLCKLLPKARKVLGIKDE